MFRLIFMVSLALIASANDYERSKTLKAESLKSSQLTQQQIDTLDDNTKAMLAEYQRTIAQTQTQHRYNTQLGDLIASQEKERVILEHDIEEIEHTHKNIIPLMQKMINNLEKFIALDIPFLKDERQKRVQRLKENIKRSDISVSNKYRQILEAYMIESDYARSIESYKAELDSRMVEFLRVGRVGLYYQSLDFKDSGMWDKKAKMFVSLERTYNAKILQAIKISKKQLAPDLLILPMMQSGVK